MGHGPRILDPAQMELQSSSLWRRLPLLGAVAAVIGIGASFALSGSNEKQFYFSWLVAFLYFMSLGLGALFFVLIHFVTKSGWGVVVRRVAENASAGLIVMFLAFIPIYLGLEKIYYHWADPAHADAIVRAKSWYLDNSGFIVRSVVYFVIWSLLAYWFRAGSVRQDESGDESLTHSRIKWAGPGVILFAVTTTFAAFDWAMTLDPHWYSTIFGVYYFAGSLVCIFAFMSLVLIGLLRSGHLEGFVTPEHLHDVGKLLFAFTVFWTYIAFSQFFLIWYGNIPEETAWYLHRMEGSWRGMSLLLALGHFIVPFFFLMSRHIKRNQLALGVGALWMMVMHFIDLHWLVMPTLHHEGYSLSLLDFTTMLGIGGLFLAAFGFFLTRAKLVPARDPRLIESVTFENF